MMLKFSPMTHKKLTCHLQISLKKNMISQHFCRKPTTKENHVLDHLSKKSAYQNNDIFTMAKLFSS
jgi:hypothetical protein